MSNKGNQHILTVVGSVTRYLYGFPTKDKTEKTTVRKLIKHIIHQEGIPSIIQSDNAAAFTGDLFKEFCDQHGIKH